MLAIVPARGGSRGILRKNVRVLDGEPLVLRKLRQARNAGVFERIVCSTDDDVIASIARIHGFEVHDRKHTAHPEATIAQTAWEVVQDLDWEGAVAVLQVTSPGLGAATIRREVRNFLDDDSLETAETATPIHDVVWTEEGPIYPNGGNRQESLPRAWRSTGGMRLYRQAEFVQTGPEMSGHHVIEVRGAEALDIDEHADLAAARLRPAPVVLMPLVGPGYGLGHLHRCLTLADELAHHDVALAVITDDDDARTQAEEAIRSTGHQVLDLAAEFQPSVTIIDRLDTPPAMVADFQGHGCPVVLLEDVGPATHLADLVVNELYGPGAPGLTGPEFAVLRPEFLVSGPHMPSVMAQPADGEPWRIVVSFGGEDPYGAAPRVAEQIRMEIGPRSPVDVQVFGPTAQNPKLIAEAMATSHILVSSAGRTLAEAARVGIPTIAIPVNDREEAHYRLPSVHYLPRLEWCTGDALLHAVWTLTEDANLRSEMSAKGRELVDGHGARRVARLVDELAETIH